MAFSVPDAGEGDNDIQSIFFQEDIDVLVAGIQGIDYVLSGLAMTGGSDMTPDVAKGAVITNGILKAVAAASVTVTAADATHPRIDLVVVTSSGSLAVRAGTPSATPKPPARTANDVVLYQVYISANDTSIGQSQLIDRRVIRGGSPQLIYKTTTAETTNTTSSAVHILDKTNSGVSIPSGLLSAGKILRVRIGGDILANNGTPTWTLIISYGGTIMWQDVTSTGFTADSDRRAFFLEFDLSAESLTVQRLAGTYAFQGAAGYTAAATGLSDIGGTSEQVGPIFGVAAVDSDAANRTLFVTMTMSVNNIADEIRVTTATVELIG